ncbi:hypothetical protein CLD22_01425 [Rubrivivax gelatinosus]|nr:hypothetical protein [Rubrivivax gelatinosus]
MSMLKRLFALVALLALASCGGGSSNPKAPDDGGGSITASAIVLQLGSETLANDGASTVSVTAIALDSKRVALPGAKLSLSVDSDAVITVGDNATETASNGTVTAAVGIGSNRTNRVITITAKSGSVTQTAQLRVVSSSAAGVASSVEVIGSATTVGTGGDTVTIQAFVKDSSNNALSNAAVAFATSTGTLSGVSAVTNSAGVASATFSAGALKTNRTATITVSAGLVESSLSLPITGTKLVVSGPTSLILAKSATYTISVVDSKGNALPGIAVTGLSVLGNSLTAVASNTTDSNGQVAFAYVASVSGNDQLTFSGAGYTADKLSVAISGDQFEFIAPAASSQIAVAQSQEVQVRLRKDGAGQAGKQITFATTGGRFGAGGASYSTTTDASGVAKASLSSTSAGPVTVQATVAETGATATLPLIIVATEPARLVLQVSPTAIAPNPSGITTSQARVIAKVTDANGNPVLGTTVNFSRIVDPSGGDLLQPSAVTDSNGQASVAYVAGSESTATNGVKLRGALAIDSGIYGDSSLTVNQSALFITLGTGNVIGNLDPQTYKKDWTVYVSDANGVAVSGVALTFKLRPLYYRTGQLELDANDVWNYSGKIYACPNEDLDADGILDPGEDTNLDGVLWPGNVITVAPGTAQTDTNGRATISILYAESFAPWVDVMLTATATVTGTESRRDAQFVVSGSVPDFSKAGGPPAGRSSPFSDSPAPAALSSCVLISE